MNIINYTNKDKMNNIIDVLLNNDTSVEDNNEIPINTDNIQLSDDEFLQYYFGGGDFESAPEKIKYDDDDDDINNDEFDDSDDEEQQLIELNDAVSTNESTISEVKTVNELNTIGNIQQVDTQQIEEIEYTAMIEFQDYECPKRNDYVMYPELFKINDEIIMNKNQIHIHFTSIYDGDERGKYIITASGILTDGRKIEIIIENISMYFDIEIDTKKCGKEEYQSRNSFLYHVQELIGADLSNKIKNHEIIQLFPSNRFSETKIDYLRLYFANSYLRGEVLKAVLKKKFITSSDDERNIYSSYLRRSKINTCGWNMISSYRTNIGSTNIQINKKYSYRFYVNHDAIIPMSDKQIEEKETALSLPIFSKNQTEVMGEDIETHAFNNTGEAPDPIMVDTYEIFMIGLTFHWYYDSKPFKEICLTTKPSFSRQNRDTIYCYGEKGLLKAYLAIFESMAPDIVIHFNGGKFDVPCIYYKLKQYGMLMEAKTALSCRINYKDTEESLSDINSFRGKYYALMIKEHVKISAEESIEIYRFNVDGVIEIDTMAIMKQLNPREQVGRLFSLNFFLKLNKLDAKDPMDYKEMDRIYMSEDSYENRCKMELVSKYCVTDALRCQQLLCKQTVVDDVRELCNTTYTGLYEGIYRANGMKVRNLLAANAFECSIAYTTIKKENVEKGKYPGALVFYPIRGWHPNLPVTGLDFSSLYPSLMMAYNLTPEMLVRTEHEKEKLEAKGYSLHKIEFTFNEIKREGWFVRHNNVMNITDKRKDIFTGKESNALPNEHMGLFPSVLKRLFEDRKIYKHKYVDLSEKREDMEIDAKAKYGDKSSVYLHENNEYLEICFKQSKMDSKQKGKKVVMNTFYGECGNPLSPSREILVAGGTTAMGQICLRTVSEYVQKLGCGLIYGDTDSTYITCPVESYAELDKKYNFYKKEEFMKLSKEQQLEYYTEKVMITMMVMQTIKDKVNKMLKEFNGTDFLSMAYEEVLYPSQFHGKKMYSGIPHLKQPNFFPKKLFKKGGMYVQGGKSALLYKICDMYMTERYNIANWDKENIHIVEELLSHLYTNKWNLDYFYKKSKYRPNKKNISVLKFVSRMNETRDKYKDDPEKLSLYPIIEPGDPINTIKIKPTIIHDFTGKKLKLSIGDLMEYPEVYLYYNQKIPGFMKLDLRYYLDSGIITTFARFICHYPQFQPSVELIKLQPIDDMYNYIDKYSIKQAETYLYNICNHLDGVNPNIIKTQNTIYKQFHKRTLTHVQNVLINKIGEDKLFLLDNNTIEIDNVYKITSYYDNIHSSLLQNAEFQYKDTWGKEFISYMINHSRKQHKKNPNYPLTTIHTIKSIYKNPKNSLINRKITIILSYIKLLEMEMKTLISQVIPMIIDNEKIIINYIMDLRKIDNDLLLPENKDKLNIDEIVVEKEIDSLITFDDKQLKIINTLHYRYRQLQIQLQLLVKYKSLYHAIDSSITHGNMMKPSNNEIKDVIMITNFEVLDDVNTFS